MSEDACKQELEAARNPRYVGGAEGSSSMQEWRRLSAEAFAAPSIETNIAQEENQGYESEVARVIFDQFPHLKARASNLLAVADRVMGCISLATSDTTRTPRTIASLARSQHSSCMPRVARHPIADAGNRLRSWNSLAR